MIMSNIRVLHLEPTTLCQAECPQCPRTYGKFIPSELSIDAVKQMFPAEFIKQLDKMFMCGNYGDPAAARDTIEICRYFRKLNPNITLGMNSNGALRDMFWWEELATVFNRPNDYVVFSIDGLEDTNEIYRRRVLWPKLMNNAKTFINKGGSAHWDMLVFEHNEHQVDACAQLAKQLGFKWFRAKVSKRHNSIPVEWIKPPKGWQDPVVESVDIACHALKEQSLYVDARGRWHPCCWQGIDNHNPNLVQWFDQLKSSWTTNPDPVCQSTCGTRAGKTSFSNQWQREIELANYSI
jgi:MoaA/NifB/PqqE/SkfB family radical SAM enzyme